MFLKMYYIRFRYLEQEIQLTDYNVYTMHKIAFSLTGFLWPH